MSHAQKFFAAILIALFTHGVASKLFEGSRVLASDDLSQFEPGPPWYVVFQFCLGLVVIGGCLFLRAKSYRHWGLATLSIWGLLAVQYLSLAIAHWQTTKYDVGFTAFAIASLLFIYSRVRHLKPDVKDRQRRTANRITEPDARPGLILFLSFLTGGRFTGRGLTTHSADPLPDGKVHETEGWSKYKADITVIVEEIAKGPEYNVKNEKLLESFGTMNIRMPLEAVRVQLALAKLTDVVLIPSSNTPRERQDTGEPPSPIPYSGSHGQATFFEEIATKLFAPLVPAAPRIKAVAGADFEDEKQISRAIADARKILDMNQAGLHNIDITGGQALCSVVGAVKCLGENDRCTYVSTRGYKSRSYDFEVDTPLEF